MWRRRPASQPSASNNLNPARPPATRGFFYGSRTAYFAYATNALESPRSHFPYQKTIPHPRLAIPSFFRYIPIMQEKEKPVNLFDNNPLAQAILREGLLIQDRFSAEPIYAKTGKGYLKSVGVEEIARVKSEAKTKTS